MALASLTGQGQRLPSVRQLLRDMMRESMLVAFPVGYKAKRLKDIDKLVYVE
jgi:hypothetical protein